MYLLDMIYRRIFGCHGNDLIIFFPVIDHLHIADHRGLYQAQGLDTFAAQYQYVERVIVFAKRLRNKTIIDRVMKR